MKTVEIEIENLKSEINKLEKERHKFELVLRLMDADNENWCMIDTRIDILQEREISAREKLKETEIELLYLRS